MTETCSIIASRLGLPLAGVRATVELLDEGATVPFISRYRKERTGRLDEVAVRDIETTLEQVRQFLKRRDFVRDAIIEAGKMSDAIAARLAKAQTLTDLEDIYAPFKPKRRTRAQMAREKGLEPLARIIMSGRAHDLRSAARRFVNNEVADIDRALAGASDVIAEWASESGRLRNILRRAYRRTGSITVAPASDVDISLFDQSPYSDYRAYSRRVEQCSPHNYLALRRGEAQGMLRVRYVLRSDEETLDDLRRAFIPREAKGESAAVIAAAVKDAFSRLMKPSVETELAAEMKQKADRASIAIFSENLHQLLMAPPLRGRRVLAIDPGFRTGCKVVALDEDGNLLDDNVIYPTPPRCDTKGAAQILRKLIDAYKLDAVALGTGTATNETRKFLLDCGIMPADAIFGVSENGASVYSASETARKEFPDRDVTLRGAVSIGRRLIDPLAELVKIDPKAIGVGQYQHDVDQNELRQALDFEVLSCVNAVGVDVNTASEQLLSYVSGIGPALAANIVKNRAEEGRFLTRADLHRVPRMGARAFELSAGFLRVPGSPDRLDDTAVHPESYPLVERIAALIGCTVQELPGSVELLDSLDAAELAREIGADAGTVGDIIADLRRPGRDPRLDDASAEAFVRSVESFGDVHPGMVLNGLVANTTAFGVFIDLGIKQMGLIHINQIPRGLRLVVGRRIKVRVLGVDDVRKRISLAYES